MSKEKVWPVNLQHVHRWVHYPRSVVMVEIYYQLHHQQVHTLIHRGITIIVIFYIDRIRRVITIN